MKNLLSALVIILCAFSTKAQNAQIIGGWQLTQVEVNGETETGLRAVFIFEDQGVLKAARDANSRTIQAGTWTYNKKKKMIVMTSELDKDFNGEAKVIKVNKKELVYKKDGATLSFIKLPKMKPAPKIEMEKPILSFEMEDLYDDEEGFDEKAEARKLPWRITAVVDYLKDKNEVVFQVTSFPDSREADTWVISTKFNYNEIEETLDARDYSYVQKDYIDMTENPISFDSFKENQEDFRFYPEDELDYYKVVSINEILKTDIGTFECTVVEGYGGFQEKIQYWMVNNQPGVFAKIIKVKEQEPPFGRTTVQITKEESIENSEVYNQNAKMEHLTFEEEDFYTDNGEYKYEADKDKLPWNNWSEVLNNLLNVKQLVYSYNAKNEGSDVFENETLTTDVIVNLENESFTIENIFRGYISTGNGDPYSNTDLMNPLYPIEDRTFRISGVEQITTPAGTFDCTVIEVATTYDLKKKLWMINDKVGVYAKIIDENTDEDSGYYHLYELEQIIISD